jgi:cytochrome bd-type quinol oxidase subunit 2
MCRSVGCARVLQLVRRASVCWVLCCVLVKVCIFSVAGISKCPLWITVFKITILQTYLYRYMKVKQHTNASQIPVYYTLLYSHSSTLSITWTIKPTISPPFIHTGAIKLRFANPSTDIIMHPAKPLRERMLWIGNRGCHFQSAKI